MKKCGINDEIILTIENNITSNGVKFPDTPRPEIRSDGIFPTKEEIILYFRNKIKSGDING